MPGGRPRGFDRDEALRAATLVFWEHGYAGASVALLTRAMGVTPPSLYSAFGDKRRLFAAAVDAYSAREGAFLHDALDHEPTAGAAVERVLRTAAREFASTDHPPGCLVCTAATNLGPADAEVGAVLRARRAADLAALEAKIAADRRAGFPRSAGDAAGVARFVMAVLAGMSQHARDGLDERALTGVAEAALRALRPA